MVYTQVEKYNRPWRVFETDKRVFELRQRVFETDKRVLKLYLNPVGESLK
jgi:hypothetical protein